MACLVIGAIHQTQEKNPLTREMVAAAENLLGLQFSDAKRDSMLGDLKENLDSYQKLRALTIDNSVPPALAFNPVPVGMKFETKRKPPVWSKPAKLAVPANLEELAYASVGELAELIRTRRITSTALTKMYLERLKKYGPKLECVITLTEELALQQAQRADAEIAAGKYRGPLHGIPYAAKDLLAKKGYKTTWGSVPYKDQIIDTDATVIQRLEQAGAVLVAKTTLGELAWGDVWFGGKTRNPWNLEQGSSGSSAGSAAATAAGLVAFSIGTETWGSIVSPSTRCGVTGLRPTYGRVSRAGAMALSWSMDKIGPICRTVEDCALVFNAIYGPDGIDQTVVDLPFNYNPNLELRQIRLGYLQSAFEKDTTNKANNEAVLAKLRELGADLIPVALPDYPINDLSFILSAEAAAAFDELTRSGKDDLMVRQIRNAWPNVFRASRFIPAVEYIQANRVRYLVIQEMAKVMANIDVYVTPSFGDNLLLTNLTGHPCVVVPNGFDKKGSPTSISFIGRLYDEATVLAVAKAYQEATAFHRQHPPLPE
ncbi:MAG: amidase [candidate division KSB1 bacterium]|nr:amidase [candidate division KSB1 bacterium]MDZ7301810.1 amidase [candidate division KSB1 bacterium]MDZ7314164.1 amidase [candidate division KSB1 bacterium]